MPCIDAVNEDWSTPVVALRNALKSINANYPAAYYDALQAFYLSCRNVPLEYVVVSGTPSEELDENGRLEIAEGNSFTDSRLEGYAVKYIIWKGKALSSNFFTQSGNTITLTTGETFTVDDIIALVYA